MNIEEAIEYLKLKIKNDNLTIQGMFGDIYEEIQKDNKAIEILLTAYEKEKEKNKEYEKQLDLDYVENNYVSKDKIKAKIEAVLKQLERKMEEEYNKYGNSREYQDMVDAYNFLQSLLEGEE